MTAWKLDKMLASDTMRVGSLATCDVLLMNDTRWPWLILVPRIEQAIEFHELYSDQRQEVDMEVAFVASVLKDISGCEKINLATIGNVVRQLHIHVIARNAGDANWPGPVWGYGTKEPYESEPSVQYLSLLRDALELEHS